MCPYYYHVLAFNCNKTILRNNWEHYFWDDSHIFNEKTLKTTHFKELFNFQGLTFCISINYSETDQLTWSLHMDGRESKV